MKLSREFQLFNDRKPHLSVSQLNHSTDSSRYIVIEGPIGVGKTSLAKKLAESLAADVLLEEVYENPFLERFYRDGQSAALPAQMFFLFARARQIEDLRQTDMFANVRVSDYLFAKDQLFADLNLSSDELHLYNKVVESLDVDAPVPDLVIYLQASVDSLLSRIGRRGIAFERAIDRKYLERLTDAYARFFHAYNDGPLLIVNASQIDPINNEADYAQLFQQIERTTGGRHFFNPVAAALA
jgi:deoxyadenosine/deoxycytidine kinase